MFTAGTGAEVALELKPARDDVEAGHKHHERDVSRAGPRVRGPRGPSANPGRAVSPVAPGRVMTQDDPPSARPTASLNAFRSHQWCATGTSGSTAIASRQGRERRRPEPRRGTGVARSPASAARQVVRPGEARPRRGREPDPPGGPRRRGPPGRVRRVGCEERASGRGRARQPARPLAVSRISKAPLRPSPVGRLRNVRGSTHRDGHM